MKYAELKSLERFDTFADIVGTYSRGRYGEYRATFRDFEMKEATPEIETLIETFRDTYEFVETKTKWIYTDDNDELGTGSSSISIDYKEIGPDCVFLLFDGKIVGVAYPKFGNMPVAWFHENKPGYNVHDDIAFHLKSEK